MNWIDGCLSLLIKWLSVRYYTQNRISQVELIRKYALGNCQCRDDFGLCNFCYWGVGSREGNDFLHELDYLSSNFQTFVNLKLEESTLSFVRTWQVPRYMEIPDSDDLFNAPRWNISCDVENCWAKAYLQYYQLIEAKLIIPDRWWLQDLVQWTIILRVPGKESNPRVCDWQNPIYENVVKEKFCFTYRNFSNNIPTLTQALNRTTDTALRRLIYNFAQQRSHTRWNLYKDLKKYCQQRNERLGVS